MTADNDWLIGDNDVTEADDCPQTAEPQPDGGRAVPTHAPSSPTAKADRGIMALLGAEPSPQTRPASPDDVRDAERPSHDDANTSTHDNADALTHDDAGARTHRRTDASTHEPTPAIQPDDANAWNISEDDQTPSVENPWNISEGAASTPPSRPGSAPTAADVSDNPWVIDDDAWTHDDADTSTHDDANASMHDDADAWTHDDATQLPTSLPADLPDQTNQPAPDQPPAADPSDPWVGFAEFSGQLDPWGQADDDQQANQSSTTQPDADSTTTDPIWGDMAEPAATTIEPPSEPPDDPWQTDPADTTPPSDAPTLAGTATNDPWGMGDPWDTTPFTADTTPDNAAPTPSPAPDATDGYDDTPDTDDDGQRSRKPIIITLIVAIILAFTACAGFAAYSITQSHRQAEAAQQAEQSRKQREFDATNAYKDAQNTARRLIAEIRDSACKDDKALKQATNQLDTLASKKPASRDAKTVQTMTDKLTASTGDVRNMYDQLMEARIGKLKTRRDTLVKTADGLKDAPKSDDRTRMTNLADTLRNLDITADNQAETAKQCDDLDTLIAKNRKAKEEADKKAKAAKEEQERRKVEEEAQRQAQQQQEQQVTPQPQYTPQYTTPAPQYTPQPQPQYTPQPQPQPQQPSGPTWVPDTGGGNDSSDM